MAFDFGSIFGALFTFSDFLAETFIFCFFSILDGLTDLFWGFLEAADRLDLVDPRLTAGFFFSTLISNLLGVAIRVLVNLEAFLANGFPPLKIFDAFWLADLFLPKRF